MKKRLLVLIAALTALVFASCSNINNPQEGKKAYIKIGLTDASRTALPAASKLTDFDSFALAGTTDDTALAINKTWTKDPSSEKIKVTIGKTYAFTLTAKKGGATWKGTQSLTVVAGENALNFSIALAELSTEGKGNIDVTLSVPAVVKEVTAKLAQMDESADVTAAGATCTLAEGKASYKANDVASGSYVVIFTLWGDTAKTLKLGEWREYAGITSGVTSASTPAIASNDELDSIYTITVNNAGGTLVGTIPGSYTRYSDAITLPQTITKEGFTFAGWSNGTSTISTIAKGSTGNISITATWTEDTNNQNQNQNPPTPTITAAQVTAMQTSITNAANGGSVTLSPSGVVPAGSTITINKPLTVNGNNIDGLTVKVASNITSNVTLKNFTKAKIQIVAPATPATPAITSNYYFARGADDETPEPPANTTQNDDSEELDHFKKFGDEGLPLFLEGCTIERFDADKDVTLHLETGDKKSEIKDLYLNNGTDGFTFIEDDKEISADNKSSVGTLYVEHGLEEINLIGGSFDDVNFADSIPDDAEIKFKYDEEFGQFDDAKLAEIKEREFIDAKDIALADNIPDAQNTGVYTFEMSPTEFAALNGHIGILFLTGEQYSAITSATPGQPDSYLASMTYDTPAYDMSIMGPFAVEKNAQGSFATGLNAVFGASRTFLDYAFTARSFKITTLEKHLSYSKEAVIIDIASDKVTVIVNKNAIKKSDILMCTGYPNVDENGQEINGKAEGGTKLTEIDLQNYVPYLGINFNGEMHYTGSGFGPIQLDPLVYPTKTPYLAQLDTNNSHFSSSNVIAEEVVAPTGMSKQSIPRVYTLFPMSKSRDADAYPDVSDVTYPDITITSDKVTVKYCNAEGTITSTELALRENISPEDDAYEYYLDNQFKKIVYVSGGATPDWDKIYEQYNIDEDANVILYALPKRTITISNPENEPYMAPELCYLNFTSNGVFNGLSEYPVLVYGSYNTSTKEYSNPITDPSTIANNSTIYIKSPVVKFNTSNGTTAEYLGTIKLVKVLEVICDMLENPNSTMSETEKSYYSKFYTTAALSTAYTSATLKFLADGADVYSDGPKFLFQENVSTGNGESSSQVTQVKTYAQFKAWLAEEENANFSFNFYYMNPETQNGSTIPITKINFGDYKQIFCSQLNGITIPPATNNNNTQGTEPTPNPDDSGSNE